jgi:hypothetical protein
MILLLDTWPSRPGCRKRALQARKPKSVCLMALAGYSIQAATRVVVAKNQVTHLEDSEPDPVFRLVLVRRFRRCALRSQHAISPESHHVSCLRKTRSGTSKTRSQTRFFGACLPKFVIVLTKLRLRPTRLVYCSRVRKNAGSPAFWPTRLPRAHAVQAPEQNLTQAL